MISKVIDENSVSFISEDSDDLLTLRRIIKNGDKIIGDTTRIIKREKDLSSIKQMLKSLPQWVIILRKVSIIYG